MDNLGQNNIANTLILSELSGAIYELGEAFAACLNDMVVQSGITNPNAQNFEISQKSWKNLAKKTDKTQDDIKKLDQDFKDAVNTLAKSYLLYIAKNVGNKSGKINYSEYEKYMPATRFGRYDVMNRPDYISKVKIKIKNAFDKISAHGEINGDDLIDKDDMAAFIFAISTKSKRVDDKFNGFEINGDIEPENYAVCERNLFEAEDNLFSTKLRVAYKELKGLL